jgi:hypothetical protein
MGAVAVNREGIVGVSWYDRRESTNDQDWFVRFAASFDGGRTFTPSVKVSEAPFSHDWSKLKGFQFHATGGGSYGEVRDPTLFLGVSPSEAYVNGGDTAGLAASIDGVFHAVWIDNRTNIPQVWTTPITVNPPAVTIDILRKSQNLNDITKDTTIDFGETNFDPTTKIVSANLYLVNTSDETLAGPMVLHVVRLDQSAEILNADNGQKGKDATFEYTSLMNDNKLRPGEKTKAKLIRLRLFGQKGNPNTGESAEPGTVMTTEVFGKKASTKP